MTSFSIRNCKIKYYRIIMAIVVGFHLVVIASVMFQNVPFIRPFFNDAVYRMGPGADFYSVYLAAVNYREGNSPYNVKSDGLTRYYYQFRYLPVMAMAFQVFTFVPPKTAFVLWILCLELLLMAVIYKLWKTIPDQTVRQISIVLLLLSSPYYLEIYMGQFTFATVCLSLLSIDLATGPVWYSLAVLLKPLPLVAIPSFIHEKKNYRYIVLSVLLVIMLSTPFFLKHPEDWHRFYTANFDLNIQLHPGRDFKSGYSTGNFGMVQLFHHLTMDLTDQTHPQRLILQVKLFRLALLTITSLIVVFSLNRKVLVGCCALLLAHFMSYQHVWEHHMSAVLVIGAFLLTDERLAKTYQKIILVCLFFLAIPTLFVFLNRSNDIRLYDPSLAWPRYISYLILSSKLVPMATLYTASITWLCKHGFGNPISIYRSSQ